MTYQEAKDIVTKQETVVYNTFNLAVRELGSTTISRICDLAAELYAQSKQIEVLENTKQLFLSGQVDYFTDAIDQTLKSIKP